MKRKTFTWRDYLPPLPKDAKERRIAEKNMVIDSDRTLLPKFRRTETEKGKYYLRYSPLFLYKRKKVIKCK